MRLGLLRYHAGERKWQVQDLAPHVAIAFKRLFPRADKAKTIHILDDSDELRSDLAWFRMRYPLETPDAHVLEEGAARVRHREAVRGEILQPNWKPPKAVGFRKGKAPRPYQQQATALALRNNALLLGDDVGFGKTISAIDMMCSGAPLPAAIVVEPHLAQQWYDRIREFSRLRAHVVESRNPYTLPRAGAYIFRYSNIAGWVDALPQLKFPSVIYDEIQQLRHGTETAKGQACSIASTLADFRVGLTATPIYNYGDEMHTVMEYIKPGLLGDLYEFRREWCGGGGKRVTDPDALGSFLRATGYYLRRDEDDPTVDSNMPPANSIVFDVPWDDGAARDEMDLMRQLAQTVLRGSFVEAGKASRELDLKLRMITGIAKARQVAAYVRMLLMSVPRVLVTGWHRDVYDIWMASLAEFNPGLYTGSESSRQKEATVERFCRGDSRVMIISNRSGAGLDGLQHYCNDIVIGELDWSAMVHKQLIGRLRRPPNDNVVNAHYPICEEGSDPVLVEVNGVKADQARGILRPGMANPLVTNETSRIRALAEYVLNS